MDDRRTDPHINDVARRLTEAAPPHDLKGRVLARIAGGDGDRWRPLAVRLAPAASMVAAAVLALTMWPLWRGEPESPAQPRPSPSAAESAIPEAQTQREPDAPLVTRSDAAPVQPPRSVPARAATRDVARPTTSELAPEPLMIAAISVDAIGAPDSSALDPLEVAGLIVTGLEIEPIGS